MAKNQRKNSSQHIINNDVQQYLNSTDENFTTINSRQFDDVRKIFIGGLNEETTENDLRDHFRKFGGIKYIYFKVEAATGHSRGYAFVVFKTMEGLENALAYSNHVINNKKIDPRRALPRHAKLFVGGLSPELTDNDIKNYFKRYATLIKAEIPYDKNKNRRKGFCFLTFDSMQAVTEILKLPRHVIKGKQVDVRLPTAKVKHYRMIPDATGPIRDMHENVMDQRGFLPQSGYTPFTPGYYYGGYCYYIPYTVYNPHYTYGYSYPSYVAEVGTDNQYGMVHLNHVVPMEIPNCKS